MKRFISFLTIVMVLVAGIAIGFMLAKQGAPSVGGRGGSAPVSVSRVQTVPIRQGEIAQSIRVYGTVVANPALERSLSVAFESRVMKVYVVKGQRVPANQPLLQIQAGPTERLKLAEAKNRVKSATAQLHLIQAEIKLQLATQADLIAARNTLATASLRLALLEHLGIGTPVTLRAPEEAVVVGRPAVPGSLKPRGAVLITLLPVNKLRVELKVLPADVRELRLGRKVDLSVDTHGGNIRRRGTISLIAGQVDPVSGLVNVYVTPNKPGDLTIGQYASGKLDTASGTGLLVPHSAVLPVGGHEEMYTVKHSRAVLHEVQIGLFNSREVEVSAPGLRAGQRVVIAGNAELTNGMAVKQGNQP